MPVDLQLAAAAVARHTIEGPPDACWSWSASTRKGRPRINIHRRSEGINRTIHAARVIVAVMEGLDLDDPWEARHTCSNGGCVNPAHLISGTRAQNLADQRERREWAEGERHYRTTLTADDVRAIRSHVALGGTQRAMVEQYGVTKQGISRIVLRKTWAHI